MRKKSLNLFIATIMIYPLCSCSIFDALFSNDVPSSTLNNSFVDNSEEITDEDSEVLDDVINDNTNTDTNTNDDKNPDLDTDKDTNPDSGGTNIEPEPEPEVNPSPGSNYNSEKYNITWIVDGEEYHDTCKKGTIPQFTGLLAKSPTKYYEYVFNKWEPEIRPVTYHQTYFATFHSVRRKYKVTYFDYDNSIIAIDEYEYGQTPSFRGKEPTRPSEEGKEYVFNGWEPNFEPITINQEYRAKYSTKASIFKITFDIDGVKHEYDYEYGEMPNYDGKIEKDVNNKYWKYTFSKWEPEIQQVKKDQTYTAVFDKERKKYKVTFKINEKQESLENEYNYFDMPTYNGGSINDEEYVMVGQSVYKLNGWNPTIYRIEKDNLVYTAKLTKIESDFFYAWDSMGTIYYTMEMPTVEQIAAVEKQEEEKLKKDKNYKRQGYKVYVYSIDISKNRASQVGDAQVVYIWNDIKHTSTSFRLMFANYLGKVRQYKKTSETRYASFY